MRTFLIATALLLAAAPAASAKGLVGASVCGADGCRTIDHPSERLLFGGAMTHGPARPEPYVRFRFLVGEGSSGAPMAMIFLPRSGLMRLQGDRRAPWTHPRAPRVVRRAAALVDPLPAAGMRAAVRHPGPVWKPQPVTTAVPRAPRGPAPASHDDGGSAPWWLALRILPAGAAALLARRRRRRPLTT